MRNVELFPLSKESEYCLMADSIQSQCFLVTYLHAQTQGVEHNEEEHEVLKVAGGDDVPHLILVGVLGYVTPQWTGLKSILHTLALKGLKREWV